MHVLLWQSLSLSPPNGGEQEHLHVYSQSADVTEHSQSKMGPGKAASSTCVAECHLPGPPRHRRCTAHLQGASVSWHVLQAARIAPPLTSPLSLRVRQRSRSHTAPPSPLCRD